MYYLLYGLMYLVSLLPLRVLYILSDGFYFLVYYIIGYRKKVVFQNLDIAFPQKTEKEKKHIAKGFYHKFIDSLVESVKLLSASDSFFQKRVIGDWHIVDRYYDQNRSVQIHLGHTFNWEWGNAAFAQNIRYQFLGVFMPISNKAVDKLFRKMRGRGGTVLLSAHRMSREFLPYRNALYCLGLVADQSPGTWLQKAKWFTFFNRKTAFTIGPAKSAIRHDTVVLFASIKRPRRGHYEVNFTVADEHPAMTDEDTLTKKFVHFLEDTITQNPEMWLWSHRRWKHVWQEGYNTVD
ncbi:MAG: lysophospholipid acyltransferase family protein [Niabella sp.]